MEQQAPIRGRRKKAAKKRPVIVPIHSEDKKGLDKHPPQDHPLSMRRGSRIALCAPPGHGKTSLAKQLLLWSRPFAAVVVITGVGDHTAEWDKVVHTKTDFAEASENWWGAMSKKHGGKPIACVCDDLNYADLGPKERSNAYKLVQFVATHLNVTVVMCSHSWVQLIPRLRRACDTIVMWAPASGGSDQLTYISRSLGLPKPLLSQAFEQCEDKFTPIVVYTDPPEGRCTVMVGFDRPFYQA
eukprot:COSAG04_NODE_63_length_30038_cov_9.461071_24_plen_242_part_00